VVCLAGFAVVAGAACKSSPGSTNLTGAAGGATGAGGGDGGATGAGGASGSGGGSDAAPGTDGPTSAPALPSAGCNKSAPTPASMVGSYGRFSLTVDGQPANATNREYFVRVPMSYDPSKPYRVIYLGPGCGELQDSVTMPEAFPIEQASGENAILVEMSQGTYNQAMYETRTCPTPGTDTCAYCFDDWAYRTSIPSGEAIEHAYFRLLHQAIEDNYCVDKNRQFYGGYSSGGWLAQQLGCWFPDVLRAQGNVTGGLPMVIASNALNGGVNDYCVDHPIAAFLIHDFLDTSNTFAGSVNGAQRIFNLNKCTGTFMMPPRPDLQTAVPPMLDPTFMPYTIDGVPNTSTFRCYQYAGCPADYPIVFCVSLNIPHTNPQTMAADAGWWQFFSGF
jgi:hypothetical protein